MIYFVIVYVIVVLGSFICFLVVGNIRTGEERFRYAAEKIIREEMLDYSLRNPFLTGNLKVPSPRRRMVGLTIGSRREKRRPLLFPADEQIFIGRDDQNQIVLKGKQFSGRHCVIERQGKKIWLRDLNSRTGTVLRRGLLGKKGIRRGRRAALRDGDLIRLDSVRIRVKLFTFDINQC